MPNAHEKSRDLRVVQGALAKKRMRISFGFLLGSAKTSRVAWFGEAAWKDLIATHA